MILVFWSKVDGGSVSKVEISKCLRSQGVCPLLMKFVQMCVENGRRCILGKSRMWKILAVQAVTPRLTLLLNCHVKNVYVSWSSSKLPRSQLAAPQMRSLRSRVNVLASLRTACSLSLAQLACYRFATPAKSADSAFSANPAFSAALRSLRSEATPRDGSADSALTNLVVPLLPICRFLRSLA